MPKTNILSWNVNGIRALARKGFLEWLADESPDILCLQETRAQPEQLGDELLEPPGYLSYWNYPDRKGYSGVALFAREEPLETGYGFPAGGLELEGRVILARYPGFTLINAYFPNGKQGEERLKYKMAFYEAFLTFIDSLRAEGESLIICGDFNTAHREIDLARPRENSKVSGFLPVEREWLDRLVAHGYVDTFRQFNGEPGQYTWWDLKSRARERNVGWRIDYFFVSKDLLPALSAAFIMPGVTSSDHCPTGITLDTG